MGPFNQLAIAQLHLAIDVAFDVALGNRLALVVLLFALGDATSTLTY